MEYYKRLVTIASKPGQQSHRLCVNPSVDAGQDPAALIARLAALEARVSALEAAQPTPAPAPPD